MNKEPVKEAAEKLYKELKQLGVEVIFDDRNKKAGFAFSDADLIDVPLRLIVSPKTVRDETAEFKLRDGSFKEQIPLQGAAQYVQEKIAAELQKYQ